jgi:hypothetical protein
MTSTTHSQQRRLGASSQSKRAVAGAWVTTGSFALVMAFSGVSHAICGDGRAAVFPLILLAVLAGSYLLWHRPRTVSDGGSIEAGRGASLLSPVAHSGGPQ